MGYCYTKNRELVCDACGHAGGVRKRTCPHKVTCSTHRTYRGQRHAIPYCYPAALCNECFKKYGGNRKLHADCKAKAAEKQVKYDAEQARLDGGDHKIVSRSGDWHKAVPKGMVGCIYGGRTWGEDERRVLVAKEYSDVEWLEDLPAGAAIPWEENAPATKEVQVA